MRLGKILILDKKLRRKNIPNKLGILIAKHGIYKFYKNQVFEACTKVLDEPNINLYNHPYPTDSYFKLIKQMPYSILEEIVEHFAASTNKQNSIKTGKKAYDNYKKFVENLAEIDKNLLKESASALMSLRKEIEDFSIIGGSSLIEEIAYIIYDTENDKYFVDKETAVSKSGGHVNSDLTGKYNSAKFIIIGDIHFHHSMSDFFSGTDEADDRRFIGLHGVIGNFQDKKTYSLNIKFNMFKEAIRNIPVDRVFTDIPEDVNPKYVRPSNLNFGGKRTSWGTPIEQMYMSPKYMDDFLGEYNDDSYMSDDYILGLYKE